MRAGSAAGCDPDRVEALIEDERARFADTHPNSIRRFEAAHRQWLYGAPSHWMRRWIGGAPPCLVAGPPGWSAVVHDVDGHRYADFCLGDTGAMCGHGHPGVADALARQASSVATAMLPSEDAARVGEALAERFGLPRWTLATSASDANRACIRLARAVTGRPRVLVFSGCYHGSVEEAHVELGEDGHRRLRNGIHDNAFPHGALSAVVHFNDVGALERVLAAGDVACVLTEPVMTNYGLVRPAPGFHEALRRLTRQTGTLLVIDETHTVSDGPGGCTGSMGLDPDLLVVGKAIAGGLPAAAWGASAPVAEAIHRVLPRVSPWERQSAHAGFGGTLAGSALTLAAMRVVLDEVLTPGAYETMHARAATLAEGTGRAIAAAGLPWLVDRIGARTETMFSPDEPRDAADVRCSRQPRLEGLLHLWLLNRGVLMTPFHAMLLTCPVTSAEDVALHVRAFTEFVEALTS